MQPRPSDLGAASAGRPGSPVPARPLIPGFPSGVRPGWKTDRLSHGPDRGRPNGAGHAARGCIAHGNRQRGFGDGLSGDGYRNRQAGRGNAPSVSALAGGYRRAGGGLFGGPVCQGRARRHQSNTRSRAHTLAGGGDFPVFPGAAGRPARTSRSLAGGARRAGARSPGTGLASLARASGRPGPHGRGGHSSQRRPAYSARPGNPRPEWTRANAVVSGGASGRVRMGALPNPRGAYSPGSAAPADRTAISLHDGTGLFAGSAATASPAGDACRPALHARRGVSATLATSGWPDGQGRGGLPWYRSHPATGETPTYMAAKTAGHAAGCRMWNG